MSSRRSVIYSLFGAAFLAGIYAITPWNAKTAGMETVAPFVKRDPATGCEYLFDFAVMTPRLNADGKQICTH